MRATTKRALVAAAAAGLVAGGGCGGGERQDENEPEGDFAVEVVRASFPERQRLGGSSNLRVTVRNAGDRTIPDVAVTLDGLDVRSREPDLASPDRPQFAVNAVRREIGGFPEAKEATPVGCDTAYVNTWACGPLRPGRTRTFSWGLTAVRAGPYDIRWSVAPGLHGRASAVAAGGGEAPRGRFSGRVSDDVPRLRIAEDGRTVLREAP